MRKAVYDLWLQHQADGMLPTSGRFLYYEAITAEIIGATCGGLRRYRQF